MPDSNAPGATISKFYAAYSRESKRLIEIPLEKSFSLFWACTNVDHLCLIGPDGPIFDHQGKQSIGKEQEWHIAEGVTDTTTYLLSATNSEGKTITQPVTVFAHPQDKTFHNLTVRSTLTMKKM